MNVWRFHGKYWNGKVKKRGNLKKNWNNITLEVLAKAIRQEEKIKGVQIGKEEVMRPCIENSIKDSTKKTIRTNKWMKYNWGYKIHIQKYFAFLYMNNEL